MRYEATERMHSTDIAYGDVWEGRSAMGTWSTASPSYYEGEKDHYWSLKTKVAAPIVLRTSYAESGTD
eukprot:979937-Rhodomonas_salina.2